MSVLTSPLASDAKFQLSDGLSRQDCPANWMGDAEELDEGGVRRKRVLPGLTSPKTTRKIRTPTTEGIEQPPDVCGICNDALHIEPGLSCLEPRRSEFGRSVGKLLDWSVANCSGALWGMLPEVDGDGSDGDGNSGNANGGSVIASELHAALHVSTTTFCHGDERIYYYNYHHMGEGEERDRQGQPRVNDKWWERLKSVQSNGAYSSGSGGAGGVADSGEGDYVCEVMVRISGKSDEVGIQESMGVCAVSLSLHDSGSVSQTRRPWRRPDIAALMRFDGVAETQRLLETVREHLIAEQDGRLHLYRTPTSTDVKRDNWWHRKYPTKQNNLKDCEGKMKKGKAKGKGNGKGKGKRKGRTAAAEQDAAQRRDVNIDGGDDGIGHGIDEDSGDEVG